MLKTPLSPQPCSSSPIRRALGIRRERRLPRPGKAEEDRHVTGRTDVRRAVHREDALERQPVVHHGEDRLLDLARVERPADQQLRSARVQDDERPGAGSVLGGHGLETRRVQDESVGLECVQLLLARLDEHRPGEERVIWVVGDHAHGDAVRGIGARERVDDVEGGLRVEMRRDLVSQALERVFGQLLVHVAPPDPVFRARLADDELVLRRAPGVDTCVDGERAALGKLCFAAEERVRVQDGRGRVPMERALGAETELRQLCAALELGHRHTCLLPRKGSIVFENGRRTTEGPLRERALQSFVSARSSRRSRRRTSGR